MIELTEQQRQELTQPEPTALDPVTNERYLLVRRETYDQLKSLLSLLESPDEGIAYINEVMAEDDAHDPLLDQYQDWKP